MKNLVMCTSQCPKSSYCLRHKESGTEPESTQAVCEYSPENCRFHLPVEDFCTACGKPLGPNPRHFHSCSTACFEDAYLK